MTNYRHNKAPSGPACAPGRATWGRDFITPINQAKVRLSQTAIKRPPRRPQVQKGRVWMDAAGQMRAGPFPVPTGALFRQLNDEV